MNPRVNGEQKDKDGKESSRIMEFASGTPGTRTMQSLGLQDPLSVAEVEAGTMRNMEILAADETGLDNVWPLSDPRQYLNRNLQYTLIWASVWDLT